MIVLFGHCKLKLFACLNSPKKVLLIGNHFSLVKNDHSKKEKIGSVEENCEQNPWSNMAQNSGAPRPQKDYITQVSEEIEGRVTKRLSKEFSRTENRILGALARLDDFLMNPLLSGHSGTTPEPTWNTSHNNQGTNEDGSQNDPHPEAGPCHGQTTRNVTLQEDHDMVTGATKQIGICHDMTGIHEEVTYCSPSTSSRK